MLFSKKVKANYSFPDLKLRQILKYFPPKRQVHIFDEHSVAGRVEGYDRGERERADGQQRENVRKQEPEGSLEAGSHRRGLPQNRPRQATGFCFSFV